MRQAKSSRGAPVSRMCRFEGPREIQGRTCKVQRVQSLFEPKNTGQAGWDAPAVMVVCGVSALKSWQRYESVRYECALCAIGPLSVKTGSFQR